MDIRPTATAKPTMSVVKVADESEIAVGDVTAFSVTHNRPRSQSQFLSMKMMMMSIMGMKVIEERHPLGIPGIKSLESSKLGWSEVP